MIEVPIILFWIWAVITGALVAGVFGLAVALETDVLRKNKRS